MMKFSIYIISIFGMLSMMSCKNDISLENDFNKNQQLPELIVTLIEPGESTVEIRWQVASGLVLPDGHEVALELGTMRRWQTRFAQKMSSGGVTATGLIGRKPYEGSIFIFDPRTGVEGPKTPVSFVTTGPIPSTPQGVVYATVQLNGSVRVDSSTLIALDEASNPSRVNTVRYFNEVDENFPNLFFGVAIRPGVVNGIWEFRAGLGFPVSSPMNSFALGHSTNPGGMSSPIRYSDLTGSTCVFRFETGQAPVVMEPYFATLRGVPIGVFLIPSP